MKRVLIAVLGICAAFAFSPATDAREAPSVTTVEVTDNIYMLQGRGGNLGVLIGDDGVLIIDSDYPGMVDSHRAALKKLQGDKPIFIINTHFHADHAGGNKSFGADGYIIAHDNVRMRLLAGKDLSDEADRRSLPTMTYEEAMRVHFNGEQLDLVHYPMGHTDGDTIIFFRNQNVVHMGDHFFVGRFPFIDLANGGSVQGYLANVRAVLDVLPDDVKIIPGHGPLATKDDLESSEQLIAASIEHVQKAIDAGKSLEETQEAGLPAELEGFGWQFINAERWISIVYNSLSGN